jgi:hypothetical protein
MLWRRRVAGVAAHVTIACFVTLSAVLAFSTAASLSLAFVTLWLWLFVTLSAVFAVSILQLFEALKSRQPGDSDWDDLVAFLQEFCSLAKHLQLLQRQNLWNKMTQLGMFEVRVC